MVFYSWSKVRRGKIQGGFDIREVLGWNKTLLLKMFWSYNHNCTFIWLKWSKEYIFKQHSGWNLEATACLSLIWQQILVIRDEFVTKVGTIDEAKCLFQVWATKGKLPLQWMKPILDAIVLPKHAFVATLAAHNALVTVDNICKRGVLLVNRNQTWRSKLARCSIAAVIYFLWQERNLRVFDGVSRDVSKLLTRIKYVVCVRMYAWSNGIFNSQMLQLLLG
ncbi:uncharacterized protein LOC141594997 [Silene latifolia]|uniref:uncharacterized protein LOC141594997 n=1 Tax=Silene latifolia TaxID=37657 RepID=UPI003D780921